LNKKRKIDGTVSGPPFLCPVKFSKPLIIVMLRWRGKACMPIKLPSRWYMPAESAVMWHVVVKWWSMQLGRLSAKVK